MRSSDSRKVRPVSPLEGATVVVTRPSASAATSKRRVTALGGAPLALPGASVRPIEDVVAARAALRAARSADVIVFVSPSAVRFAYAISPRLRFGRTALVCAIGAATARALRRRGVRDVVWPRTRQDSEGLLALPELASLHDQSMVLVGAPQGRDLLPRELRTRGAQVSHVHVYRRLPARLDRRHFDSIADATQPIFVQLTSVESVANVRAILPAALWAKIVAAEAVVSSARIAAAARAAGWRHVHIAASAGVRDMTEATRLAFGQKWRAAKSRKAGD